MAKMADLYLKHEMMLEEENVERQQLAEVFNGKMASLSDELTKRKEDRMALTEKHNQVRSAI